MRQKKPIPVSGSIFACFVCDLMNLLTTLINQFVGYQRIDVFISFISLNENMVKWLHPWFCKAYVLLHGK